jgi:signal transduction histidine kinase
MDTHQTKIYFAVIITAVVLGVIILYFAISIIRQQKRNLQLQKAAILAEIAAMEKERARIAADLHDDLAPVLSVIKFQVDNVEAINSEEKEQLERASEHLDSLVARIREIANNLMPSALHRKGLITAVREFADKANAQGKANISLDYSDEVNLSAENNINIYRAIQEVVHNCLKHAEASELHITISRKGDTLAVLCRDNGKGFDFEKRLSEGNGIGLRSLRNRTEMMGGSLTVESKTGKGTAYLFEIPIA